MITAILLAAGTSTRMGANNKLLEPLHGKPLFLYALDALLASAIEHIVLVTGHEANRIEQVMGQRKVTVVHNAKYKQGMTSSIQVGIEACPANCAGYLICLGDMPHLTPQAINLLLQAYHDQGNTMAIVQPTYNNRPGNPVLFGRSYRQELLQHTEPEGCKGVVQANRPNVVRLPLQAKGVLIDVDTPEALFNIRQQLPPEQTS